AVEHDDPHARRGEPAHGGAAEPPGAAGDDGRPSFEIHVLPSVEWCRAHVVHHAPGGRDRRASGGQRAKEKPPLTGIVWPVTQPARGLARAVTIQAASAGSPGRRTT